MRPEYLYTLIFIGFALVLFVRRLGSGRISPLAAAAVAGAITPAVLPLVPVPHLTTALLVGAGFYMIFCEVVESATDSAKPRG